MTNGKVSTGSVPWWSSTSQLLCWALYYPKTLWSALLLSSEKWDRAGTLLPYRLAIEMNKSLVMESPKKTGERGGDQSRSVLEHQWGEGVTNQEASVIAQCGVQPRRHQRNPKHTIKKQR